MEHIAHKELKSQGFPVFLPLLEKRMPNRHKSIVPLFGRYLFASPINGFWSSMRSTRGVSDVLRDPNGKPYEVAIRDVERLMREIVVQPIRAATHKAGTVLRALSGPMATLTGTCVLDDGERVKLLHTLFGRPVEKWYAPEDVEAA